MKNIFFIILAVAGAGALGWFVGRGHSPAEAESSGRKVAFYQSAMHPWIKSDQPGNCTICGMKLTPVYEGDSGFAVEGNLVTLSSNAISVIHVQTERVEPRILERTLKVAGRIEAKETAQRILSAYIDGRVDKLFVNFAGAEVKAGEPLALLYSPALLTAEREYLTVLNQTNVSSSPQLENERARLLQGAQFRLKRFGVTDEQLVQLPQKGATSFVSQVVAPISGTVVNRAVTEGQYVKEGEKLFEIADLSEMWFQFDVYEQDLAFVRLGQKVEVTSPATGEKVFEGTITFIDPNISEVSRSARVRVELTNPFIGEAGRERRVLYNGLYANGTIRFQSEPVLAVKRSAIIDPGDQPRVYVEQGPGAYEHRPVTVGIRGEHFTEIRSGVTAGETVVIAGNMLLDSQAQINQSGQPAEVSAEIENKISEPMHKGEPLSEGQTRSARNFIKAATLISTALAADDRDAFNAAIPNVTEQIGDLEKAFEGVPHLSNLAAKVAETAALEQAPNLVIARSGFLPFSLAVSEFTQALEKHGMKGAAKVYQCPMYPERGKKAFWIQAEGPLRNPFYGAEMIDCGQEVK